MTDRQPDPERTRWLDRPRNIDRLVHGLWVVCALLLVAEFFDTGHPEFAFSGWFGFYAGYGFVVYCLIVFTAKALRRLLWRRERYYGEDTPGDDEPHE